MPSVVFVNSTKEAIEDSDFVCIATEWPEFFEFDYASLIDEVEDKLIVDCQNRLDKEEIKKKGFEYIGVGRS